MNENEIRVLHNWAEDLVTQVNKVLEQALAAQAGVIVCFETAHRDRLLADRMVRECIRIDQRRLEFEEWLRDRFSR